MMVNCPYCGAAIPTENINMQRLAALCQDCGHVFEFGHDIPARKAKKREIEQPPRLRTRQDENRLEMAYRWVFGPSDKVGFGISVFLSFVLTAVFLAAMSDSTAPLLVLLLFGPLMAAFWYMVVVFLSTVTRIAVDDDQLAVKSGPLPFPFYGDKTLNRDEVARIYCEETSESKQAGGVDRYHHVWVELDGGKRLAIQKSLPEDYALYIAQQLEQFMLVEDDETPLVIPGDEFHGDAELNIAHLAESDEKSDTQTH
jgi:hypothetical protein